MFHNFGYEVTSLLKIAENLRLELRHPYVGTEHLLLALLKEDEEIKKICLEFNLTYERFRDELLVTVGMAKKEQEINLYTPMLKHVLELALSEAVETNGGVVLPTYLFLAILEEGDGVAVRLLSGLDIDLEELYDALKMSVTVEKKKSHLEIMKIGIHLTSKARKLTPLVGRDKEIDFMIETLLRKQKNNPLLIGKAGVGKTAIVEELARRIVKKEVPRELQDMEIYELEMGSLVAGTKYRGEFEERLTKLIKEVIANKHIIIFIDEIHSMVNAGGAEGAICAADILKPYLARGELKVIGATTSNEYHEFISKDKALDRRFERIVVEEPDKKMMLDILNNIKNTYENHYDIKLTNENLEDLYNLADEYLFNKNNPDKTIDLLDSVCARIKMNDSKALDDGVRELEKTLKKKEKYLKAGSYKYALEIARQEDKLRKKQLDKKKYLIMTKEDIIDVIENKTRMILKKKEDVLKSLKSNLYNSILGQDKVINDLIFAIENGKQKATSFLLVGPSGVGKTETVKVISETLKTNLLRIDMSEYHLAESINRLIGAPSGYVGYGKDYVFRELLEKPYTTILFDEIEKAHPKVLNLLLQILDEGFITDSLGNKIRFDHTYIFLTSNIKVGDKIGFSSSLNNNLDDILSKELMGRIDVVLPYANITKDVALKYIDKNLKNKDITAEELIKMSDIEKYGLRNLRNLIEKYNKKVFNVS